MTNWDDFRFLLAVEQTGSLSAAARHLLVSQPTVSRRIAELEKSLGVVLIERLPDGHRLSTNGVKVCERARAIQQKAEEIAEAVWSQLLKRINGESGPVVNTVLETELLIRDSVKSISAQGEKGGGGEILDIKGVLGRS